MEQLDPITTAAVRLLARETYAKASNDDIEVDDDAPVIRSDDGYWVGAWVFVHDEDLRT